MSSENEDPRAAVLPAWLRAYERSNPEGQAFAAGAALAHLQFYLAQQGSALPQDLLRDRLGLAAAVACLSIEGRPSSEAELRDAVLLTPAGDPVGPSGECYLLWRKALRLDLSRRGFAGKLAAFDPVMPVEFPQIWAAHAGAERTPVAAASALLGDMLQVAPRAESLALICAEARLSLALGAPRLMPLFTPQLRRRDLSADAETRQAALHLAVIKGAGAAIALGFDLRRRAGRLQAVVPKLRSKRAPAAVGAVLSFDAIAPVPSLSPVIAGSGIAMTDRAARRFCERLVELGVLRELTGRSSFRLYGL